MDCVALWCCSVYNNQLSFESPPERWIVSPAMGYIFSVSWNFTACPWSANASSKSPAARSMSLLKKYVLGFYMQRFMLITDLSLSSGKVAGRPIGGGLCGWMLRHLCSGTFPFLKRHLAAHSCFLHFVFTCLPEFHPRIIIWSLFWLLLIWILGLWIEISAASCVVSAWFGGPCFSPVQPPAQNRTITHIRQWRTLFFITKSCKDYLQGWRLPSPLEQPVAELSSTLFPAKFFLMSIYLLNLGSASSIVPAYWCCTDSGCFPPYFSFNAELSAVAAIVLRRSLFL